MRTARVPRRVWGGTGLLVLGRLWGSACTLGYLFLGARHLSGDGFGRLTFYLALFMVLDALADKHGHVVATGGGFPCEPGVMDRLLQLGTVVWLAADFEAAYARANRVGGRPMLAGRSAGEAAAMYRTRQEFYRRAHLALDTTQLTVDAVVGRIVRHLRERERAARPAATPAEGEPSVNAGDHA